ncbi:hypothetical protein FGIG_06306 [Fasciola gigantica]|uniref:Coiled-coil domain-containing protein n=1 Tax=Fasciola gigantica TaxID=46835 RepID=A0A504XHC1_FASGI|nr:hypothetical protein FGIG_06306 [Fasciola gigantica]
MNVNGVQESISKVAYADAVAQENLWLGYRQILRQTNEKLEESIKTVEDQLDLIQDEGNEWKTRFELQKEFNEYYKKAFFICDQHIPKAKMILRMINRAARRGSRVTDQLDLDEDSIDVMDSYAEYVRRLCKELENRVDQEGKAYYWATDLRKRALIELNYTYVPAPATKTSEEKTNKAAEMSLARRLQRPRRLDPKYGMTKLGVMARKLPPMHF